MNKLKTIGFWILSFTWGLPLTLIGCGIAFVLLIAGYKPKRFHGLVHFQVGERWGGFEAGPFFLTDKTPTLHTKQHESGHGIQNIIFGPFMLFIVTIPSAIRYWYRELKYYRKGKIPPTDYDSIWFEGQATRFGEKYFKESD